MIQSMTGFGSAEREGFKVDIKSLNHRYIDISVRMPSVLSEHEMPLRSMIKERFVRGKFEVTVSFTEKRLYNLKVNKEMAKGIYQAFLDLQRDLSIPGTINIDFFSRYCDILIAEEPHYSADVLYNVFNDALNSVESMRNREGRILMEEMMKGIDSLKSIREEIETLSKNIVYNYQKSLSARIAELLSDLSVDESRLAQEVALLAQKGDVTEELSRLKSHINQFSSILLEGGAVGRKLDFLLQEMNREANTIASKVDDLNIINLTIGLKADIERLREQSQNIQ